MSHAVGWSKSRSAVSLLNSSEKRDGNRHTESQLGKRFDLGGNADSRGEDVYGMMYGMAGGCPANSHRLQPPDPSCTKARLH